MTEQCRARCSVSQKLKKYRNSHGFRHPVLAVTPRRRPQEPSLNLPLDKVSFIILKAREYDVKESDSDPDEGSNAIDDGQTDVLTDKHDDPVREELLGAIRGAER